MQSRRRCSCAGGAPGALGQDDLTTCDHVYMPPNTTGPMTAVIVAPGGSYARLSMISKARAGRIISTRSASWRSCALSSDRIPPSDSSSATRSVRSVPCVRAPPRAHRGGSHRHHGFSAGGHLASSASTHFDNGKPDAADPIDRVSSRPTSRCSAYPVFRSSSRSRIRFEDEPARRLSGCGLARSLSSETRSRRRHRRHSLSHERRYGRPPEMPSPTSSRCAEPESRRDARLPERSDGTGLGQQDPALAEWPRLLANWLRVSGS